MASAAFFDLDKTVIAKASVAAFGGPFRRGGLITRRVVARALLGQLVFLHLGADQRRLSRIRETMLSLTEGWDRAEVRSIVQRALHETIEPIIYTEALVQIREHREAGHRVYLVSASPAELVEPLAEMIGADGAIASRGEVDDQGRYTGRMELYASGPVKAEEVRSLAARAGIDLATSFAYSDSATDLPMLELVGHPIAVNPDRALARVARSRQWEIRTFTKPVRLRNRLSLRVPALTGGLAAAAALVVWHHARRAVRQPRPMAQCRPPSTPAGIH